MSTESLAPKSETLKNRLYGHIHSIGMHNIKKNEITISFFYAIYIVMIHHIHAVCHSCTNKQSFFFSILDTYRNVMFLVCRSYVINM